MSDDGDLTAWWLQLLGKHDDRKAALEQAYQSLENVGLLGRVVVHRYICQARGCKLATVIRVAGQNIARTSDYKFSPGLNKARSVPVAREKNTLDGHRHWPGHTFDVDDLARWGASAGMDMNCRHGVRTVRAVDVLADIATATPGRPGPPSRI